MNWTWTLLIHGIIYVRLYVEHRIYFKMKFHLKNQTFQRSDYLHIFIWKENLSYLFTYFANLRTRIQIWPTFFIIPVFLLEKVV